MRPMIIGRDNPSPFLPPLDPGVPGSSGWRLWKMMSDLRPGFSQADFRSSFVLANVEDDPPVTGTAFLLGEEARRRYGARDMFLHAQVVGGIKFRCVPHPSGLCRFYNDPASRIVVGMALLEEVGRW